ncbi:MAG: alpha/beta hydrolase, partial [Candidatus Hodarchaeota archaeon]
NEMIQLAEKAKTENRLLNAAFYYRGAEFFTDPTDPDKISLYDQFIELFNRSIKNDEVERFSIPYEDGYLLALRLPPKESRGTIIIHGGFDSFMEEFYSMARYLRDNDYEVILFEGPGQGAALRRYNLTLNYEWEKSVSTVLDFFNFENVTLIGISLGGYLCLRAAAFEPRIARVVAFGILYHYPLKNGTIYYLLMKIIMKTRNARSFINNSAQKQIKTNLAAQWGINHGMFITGTKTPYDYVTYMWQLSAENLHSSRIKQDVLLLHGEKDHFAPLKLYYKQKKALINAKSVTGRIFTREEQAQNHCQVGNIKLALDYILHWIP